MHAFVVNKATNVQIAYRLAVTNLEYRAVERRVMPSLGEIESEAKNVSDVAIGGNEGDQVFDVDEKTYTA